MPSEIPAIRSISDLARMAGVSVSTVSRALTGKGTLNQATRDRIRALADSHGFRLNVAAQNLRLGRTGAIGVLFPLGHERTQELSDPFFSAMLGHLANALTDHGYDLLLSRVMPTGPGWLDDYVRSGRTDGLIMIGQSDQGAVINATAAHYAPMVVWGAYSPDHRYTSVGTDNHVGGALAARHLLARGCTRLAWFGHADAPEFAAREAGFFEALPDAVRRTCTRLPIGLTAEASLDAVTAWFAAAKFGIRVPDDMAVIGFDDIVLAQVCQPPLTTVRQDIAGGARMMVDLLLRRIAGHETQSVQFAPRLIVRGSA
jgi:DNA-binding LacI/PurR family transcriptional regulator